MTDPYASSTPSATSSNATPSPESASAPLPASPAFPAFDFVQTHDGMDPLSDQSMEMMTGKQPSVDWPIWSGDMLGNDSDASAWNFHPQMDVDPNMDVFVNPSALSYPNAGDSYPSATPQELLGLAPLLDAFAFELKIPQQPQPQAPSDPLTPAPTPPSEQLSMEEALAQMVRNATGIRSAVVAGAQHMTMQPRPTLLMPQPPPVHTTMLSPTGPGGARPGHARAREQLQPSPTSSASGSPPPPSKPARSKTSHTTIERRYRTNLNARILALRAAVPATAVLDADSSMRPDARGYVDGVKAARKGSKATILGKAVEYITVLKKRENRLRRDTAGLRALIGSLVGGQELLTSWDTTWQARFGTEQDDEEGGGEEGSDDEEDSGGDDERPRKKPKTSEAAPPAVPKKTKEEPAAERRKRGRPRKPATMPLTPPLQAMDQPNYFAAQLQQAQPATALFAVFAFVSFFAPREQGDATNHAHTHQGSVLGMPQLKAGSWHWGDVLNILHFLATVTVILTVLIPLLPRLLRNLPNLRSTKAVPTKVQEAEDSEEDATLVMSSSIMSDASSTETESTPSSPSSTVTETPLPPLDAAAKEMEAALGPRAAIAEGARLGLSYLGIKREAADTTEVQFWVRRGEVLLVLGDRAPLAPRIATRFALARRLAGSGWVSARALAVLALLGADAKVWARARTLTPRDASEAAALRLPLDAALDALENPKQPHREDAADPMRVLAAAWVRRETEEKPGAAFKRAANGEREPEAKEEQQGGDALCAELRCSEEHADGQDLVRAAVKLREVLPRGINGTIAEGADVLGLRRALAADVFERGEQEIEELRDRVVDWLCRHARQTVA